MNRPARPARPTLIAALALVSALVLAGCGEDELPRYESDEPAAPRFNPCNALEVTEVSRLVGADLTLSAGTDAEPECRLTPVVEGGPVLNANYMLTDVPLASIFETMTQLETDDVQQVSVRGADDARIVVDSADGQLFVSGFVQNGDLVQTLDLVQPAPFDRAAATRGVREVLGLLSVGAPAEITTPTVPDPTTEPTTGP